MRSRHLKDFNNDKIAVSTHVRNNKSLKDKKYSLVNNNPTGDR